MSRTNKVNPDHYKVAGRLSPDDLARERWKQQPTGLGGGRREKPQPPWMQQETDAQSSAWREPPDEAPIEAVGASEPAPQPEAAGRSTRSATAGGRRKTSAEPSITTRTRTAARAAKGSARKATAKKATAKKASASQANASSARRARSNEQPSRRLTKKREAGRKRSDR